MNIEFSIYLIIVTFIVLAYLSDCLVRLCITFARRARILDIANDRSLHSGSKPRTGGLVFVVLITLDLLCISSLPIPETEGLQLFPFVLASLLIAVISFYDDVKGLPTSLRFGVHFSSALAIVFFYCSHAWLQLPGGLVITNESLVQSCLVFWVVGLTNAYNFMDGCDGIAGTQAFVGGLGWLLLSITQEVDAFSGFQGVVLAGAAIGFLHHNWQPSRVFMGDVGSAFLGFTFACIPILAVEDQQDLGQTLGAGALLVWPFIMDASFTFTRRLLRGENVFRAHRSHLYQRLVLSGWRHSRVALLYGALAITGWPLSLLWSNGQRWALILCPFFVVILFASLWYLVRIEESKHPKLT